MDLTRISVQSLKEIRHIVKEIQRERFLSGGAFMEFFRGHADNNYKLLPGLTRFGKPIDEITSIEKESFSRFNDKKTEFQISKVATPCQKV